LKKISIIGKGTAGCMSAAYFSHYTDHEVDWYFDPKIKPQAVGEGSNLSLPNRLNDIFGFGARDFSKIDGTVKTGIYKENWGKGMEPFLHDFPSPLNAIHFSAPKLQDYVLERLQGRVNVKEENVLAEEIDSDYIMDCSGRPISYEDFSESSYIPVNSVYVTQCYWDYPRFNYTLTIARPYGWVFGIPLGNRCSVGYMYNNKINSLEEVKEDVQNIFKQYNLTPSLDTNSFSFKNYKRRSNIKGNIAYNGNASFFLEPIEATSFSTVDSINCLTNEHWFHGVDLELSERRYNATIDSNENIIMLHYFAGSDFKTEFWDYAEHRGQECIKNADESLNFMLDNCTGLPSLGSYSSNFNLPSNPSVELNALHRSWWEGSFSQNKIGLGLCQ
tara:strand:- start:36 stop:1199 length:1164 start_codon:yes stop_codon:yes gene_type:complete